MPNRLFIATSFLLLVASCSVVKKRKAAISSSRDSSYLVTSAAKRQQSGGATLLHQLRDTGKKTTAVLSQRETWTVKRLQPVYPNLPTMISAGVPMPVDTGAYEYSYTLETTSANTTEQQGKDSNALSSGYYLDTSDSSGTSQGEVNEDKNQKEASQNRYRFLQGIGIGVGFVLLLVLLWFVVRRILKINNPLV